MPLSGASVVRSQESCGHGLVVNKQKTDPPTPAINYKKLFKIMIDRNMRRKDLHEITGISYATITKLYNGDNITMEVIEKICTGMNL